MERKFYLIPAKFYLILLNKIHPFYDGNDRMCKITNDVIIRQK